MRHREAVVIVRFLIRAYEAGDDDHTLAFYLIELIKELRKK